MNAITRIEAPPTRLAEQMEAEGLFQVRFWRSARQFTVELFDGRNGRGNTIREAVEAAKAVAA